MYSHELCEYASSVQRTSIEQSLPKI